MRARWPWVLAVGLWLAAVGRDGFDAWVDVTTLPPLVAETSVEVVARDGRLLRAFTVAGDRWRMAVGLDGVDPDFLAMLVAYEDKRFHRHHGVDPVALLRAAGQAALNGGDRKSVV